MAFTPKDASRACLRRSRRHLSLAKMDLPDPKIITDLRRSALVMAVAAIDTYMHWLIIKNLSSIRAGEQLPNSLKRYSIPFDELSSLADAAIKTQREKRSWRPGVRVNQTLHREILKDTFQSYEQVGKAFSLSGIRNAWKMVADESRETAGEIKKRLDKIVQRRNQIVHEGDIVRSSRPRDLKYNKLSHNEVTEDVLWIEGILRSMDKVVTQAVSA